MAASKIKFAMIFLSVFFVSFLPGSDVLAESDYTAAMRNADGRIAAYESALQTGDPAKIRAAALELQKDPLAVRRVNANKGDAFKVRLNRELNTIQSNTKNLVRQRVAKQYGVPESEVTFFEATNPSQEIKVGQDWDVTVQVKGKDVPLDVSTDIVHESYYEAATGKKPPSTRAASDFAHQQAVEVTNYQHPEAYGGGGKRMVNGQQMTEGGEIIVGDKSKPLRDPHQLTEVMEHKSNMARNQAQDIIQKAEVKIKNDGLTGKAAEQARAQARADSQAWEMEQARQYTKQFDRQTKPRVESRGGKIPNQVQKGTDVIRQVGEGKISPAEGRRILETMGETPESIIKKGTGLHEAAQTLGDSPQDVISRAKSGQSPGDVFTENVKNRIEIKKMERAAAGQNEPALTGAQAASGESTLGSVRSKIKSAEVKMGQLAEADMARVNQVGSKVGVTITSELPASAGALRRGANAVANAGAGALAVGGAALEGGTIGYGVGKTLVNMKDAYNEDDPEMREHLINRAKENAMETAEHAATTTVMIGATVASPVVAGGALTGYGAYQGTRAALENTETGRAIDKTVQDGMTSALTTLDDATRFVTGKKSYDEIDRENLSKRQSAWLNALERGDIQLQEGATVQDMLDLVKRQQADGNVSSIQNLGDMGNVVVRVDKTPQGQTTIVDDARVTGESATDDLLAAAMVANQPTQRQRAEQQNSNGGGSAEATQLVNNFTGSSSSGLTDQDRLQDQDTSLTSGSRGVQKNDIAEENNRTRERKRQEDEQKRQQQAIDAEKYTTDWASTIQGINAAISNLNQQDAAKVTQMTQDAIKLIEQLQSGEINDADFTAELTRLQTEGEQLRKQAQQGWTNIANQLINGQVNGGNGGGVAGSGLGGNAAVNAILSSVPPDQVDQRTVVCDTKSQSGSNTPASISVDMKGGTGVATLSYKFYSVKDRALVQVNGATVGDTGCTSGSSTVPIQVSGGDQVRVIVQPACEGSSTQWDICVSCPKAP